MVTTRGKPFEKDNLQSYTITLKTISQRMKALTRWILTSPQKTKLIQEAHTKRLQATLADMLSLRETLKFFHDDLRNALKFRIERRKIPISRKETRKELPS